MKTTAESEPATPTKTWRLRRNLLKQERTAKVGIKAKRKKAGWDHDYPSKS